MIPAKVIALIPRLGTSFDAEAIATRDAIGRLLKAAGLDWHDFAAACGSIRPMVGDPETSPMPSTSPSFGDLARAARDLDQGRLSPRERGFVMEMCSKGFSFRPSSRQAAWLDDILDRLHGRAAA